MANGNQWIPFAIMGGVALFMGLLFAGSMYLTKKRRKELEALADELGFAFSATMATTSLQDLPAFQLFAEGRDQRIDNMLSGTTNSVDVRIFDWYYKTGSGKHTKHHTVTVVAVGSTELNLPQMRGRPETVLDWFGLTFDGRDIDFENRPEFSKKYHLHGTDEAAIRALFDDGLFAFFEETKNAYFEAKGNWFVFCLVEKKVPVAEIREHFKRGFRLFVLLKDACQSGKGRKFQTEGDAEPSN